MNFLSKFYETGVAILEDIVIRLPTGKEHLSGAGLIHFEGFFHGVTSWIEVNCLKRI